MEHRVKSPQPPFTKGGGRGGIIIVASVVRPTLLYISSEAVIPAKAGIQFKNTGFRVKPGMTIKVKDFLTQHTSNLA